MTLPKLTFTTFNTLEMKEISCAHCEGLHWVFNHTEGPYYCSHVCRERAEPTTTAEAVNEALEQRVGDEVI